MSDEVERTLCQLPFVHVFKIPVRASADGHRAADWPKEPSWTGKMKIIARGRNLAIVLYDDTKTFAVCHANDESAVERCLDSGRYFVLRIANEQGRKAYIGIAFNERNDSFDFNVALNEFKQELLREDKAAQVGDVPSEPMRDMSLKDGQKIKIKINLKKKNADGEEEGDADVSGGAVAASARVRAPPTVGVTGKGLLPPPKGGLLPPPGGTTSPGVARAPSGYNLKPTASSTAATSSAPAASAAFATSDPFGDDPFSATSTAAFANNKTSNDTVFGFGGTTSDPFAAAPSSFENGAAAAPTKPPKPSKPNGEANLLDF